MIDVKHPPPKKKMYSEFPLKDNWDSIWVHICIGNRSWGAGYWTKLYVKFPRCRIPHLWYISNISLNVKVCSHQILDSSSVRHKWEKGRCPKWFQEIGWQDLLVKRRMDCQALKTQPWEPFQGNIDSSQISLWRFINIFIGMWHFTITTIKKKFEIDLDIFITQVMSCEIRFCETSSYKIQYSPFKQSCCSPFTESPSDLLKIIQLSFSVKVYHISTHLHNLSISGHFVSVISTEFNSRTFLELIFLRVTAWRGAQVFFGP